MKVVTGVFSILFLITVAAMGGPIIVTQTTNPTTLATALGGGGGLTINSVTIANGAASQFGTYTNFTSPPVTIGNGVVLSSGQVVQTTPAFHSTGGLPSTDTGTAGTSEFNSYGTGRISNFNASFDVASLMVTFTLDAASQVGFDFVFGSVEYPVYTNQFTDAFLAFLDGTAAANQIVFDAANKPVQVGTSFASALTTADTNTAFSAPHGLMRLTTFTVGQLTAGTHTLKFEVGDVNDHILDSAVFISNLHAGVGTGGTIPPVPEPATLGLVGLALAGLVAVRRRCF